MKRLAIGLSDFKHLIEEDFYYFDKTKFIEEIIKDGSEVKLFARPRRFGKTLNMSMLKYFFDIKNREENKKIFKDLYIEKTEAFKEQGQYPVIFLSLKDLKALTWEQMEKAIKSAISRLFSEYKYLLNDLDKFDTLTFENILLKNTELEDLKEALNRIGIQGMTVSQVFGCGLQKGHTEVYRGQEYAVNLVPMVKVDRKSVV